MSSWPETVAYSWSSDPGNHDAVRDDRLFSLSEPPAGEDIRAHAACYTLPMLPVAKHVGELLPYRPPT